MKHARAQLRLLITIVGLLSACRPSPDYSHRIFVRNGSGEVIAVAQIAVPVAMPKNQSLIGGKWMLKTWESEFPQHAASSEDYAVSLYEERFIFDLNPNWADNNVVLTGESVGPMYLGTWCYQTIAGCAATGTFEMVPIQDSEKQDTGQINAPPHSHAA